MQPGEFVEPDDRAAFDGEAALEMASVCQPDVLLIVFLILAVLSYVGHGYRRRSFWG